MVESTQRNRVGVSSRTPAIEPLLAVEGFAEAPHDVGLQLEQCRVRGLALVRRRDRPAQNSAGQTAHG